jgi:type IV secretion system protein VirB5
MSIVYRLTFTIFLLMMSVKAVATMPVVDVAAGLRAIELITEAKEQVKNLERQLSQLDNISDLNRQQYNFIQQNAHGNYGYGRLGNSETDLYKRQWSHNSWLDALNGANNGHTSAFVKAENHYRTLYPVVDASHIAPSRSRNNLSRTYYDQSTKINRAALAASSQSYEQINDHIKNLHQMLLKLEDSPNEKAALDLNARLIAEIGFIQLEMLRQQILQNQLSATASQATTNGMSDESQFKHFNPRG